MNKWILALVVLCLFTGCIERFDPNTGRTYKQLDPNVVADIQTGLSVTSGTAQAVSPIWPPATLVVALAGLAGVVVERLGKKKLKAKAESYNVEAEGYAVAGGTVVRAIETYKTDHPKEWKKLKPYFVDLMGPNGENIIRAWRGLPPKE